MINRELQHIINDAKIIILKIEPAQYLSNHVRVQFKCQSLTSVLTLNKDFMNKDSARALTLIFKNHIARHTL